MEYEMFEILKQTWVHLQRSTSDLAFLILEYVIFDCFLKSNKSASAEVYIRSGAFDFDM